jgi:hypothetical protein
MKVRILPSAIADLEGGKDFYNEQGEGLGDYFIDSLFSDIDSLALYAGILSSAAFKPIPLRNLLSGDGGYGRRLARDGLSATTEQNQTSFEKNLKLSCSH